MKTSLCSEAVEAFLQHLRDSFEVSAGEEGCTIVSPFLRSDNECIELEIVALETGELKVSDTCETIDYLFVNGLNVGRSKELQRRVQHIARRLGADLSGDEISKVTAPSELGRAVYSVMSAAQEISYLIYKKLRRPPPTFIEEVEKFLITNNVAYDSDFRLKGKSREHTFRFYVNGERQMLLEPVTATSPHAAQVKAQLLAFRWVDIREVWPSYQKVAVIDDIEAKSQFWTEHINVLSEYSDRVIRWTQNRDLLTALSTPRKRA